VEELGRGTWVGEGVNLIALSILLMMVRPDKYLQRLHKIYSVPVQLIQCLIVLTKMRADIGIMVLESIKLLTRSYSRAWTPRRPVIHYLVRARSETSNYVLGWRKNPTLSDMTR